MENGHSHMKRMNEMGVIGIFRCTDCGQEGRLGEMLKLSCDSKEKTSKEVALIDAIEGGE